MLKKITDGLDGELCVDDLSGVFSNEKEAGFDVQREISDGDWQMMCESLKNLEGTWINFAVMGALMTILFPERRGQLNLGGNLRGDVCDLLIAVRNQIFDTSSPQRAAYLTMDLGLKILFPVGLGYQQSGLKISQHEGLIENYAQPVETVLNLINKQKIAFLISQFYPDLAKDFPRGDIFALEKCCRAQHVIQDSFERCFFGEVDFYDLLPNTLLLKYFKKLHRQFDYGPEFMSKLRGWFDFWQEAKDRRCLAESAGVLRILSGGDLEIGAQGVKFYDRRPDFEVEHLRLPLGKRLKDASLGELDNQRANDL